MKLFTQHPKENGQTYFGHLKFAWTFGCLCLLAGVFALVHGLFPSLFPTSSSEIIKRLYSKLSH